MTEPMSARCIALPNGNRVTVMRRPNGDAYVRFVNVENGAAHVTTDILMSEACASALVQLLLETEARSELSLAIPEPESESQDGQSATSATTMTTVDNDHSDEA